MSDARGRASFTVPMTRREAVASGLSLAAGGALATWPGQPAAVAAHQATPVAESRQEQAEAVVALAREAMARYDLKAVILRVVIDGQNLVTTALGESMTGVPATPEMRFRNGAVTY